MLWEVSSKFCVSCQQKSSSLPYPILPSFVPSDCKKPHYYLCVPRDFWDLYCPCRPATRRFQTWEKLGQSSTSSMTEPSKYGKIQQPTSLFQNEPIRIKMSPKTWCSVQTSAARMNKVGSWEHGIRFVIENQAILIPILFFAVDEAITEVSTQSLWHDASLFRVVVGNQTITEYRCN